METKEILDLIKKAKEGNYEAQNRIILEYTPLIHSINKSWGNTEDGFQEGAIGLLRALELFNPGQGTKFSSYAYAFINQRVRRCREKELYKTSYSQIEKIQKNKLEKTIEIEMKEDFLEVPAPSKNIEHELMMKELVKEACSPKEEMMIYKIYVEGYTCEALGKEMNLSRQRVSKVMKEILQKMRKYFYENNLND